MKHTEKSAENHVDTGISAWYNDSARGKNPELIFVRAPRDTVIFLTMHTWLFLYAAMMRDIITILKINSGVSVSSPRKESFVVDFVQSKFVRAVWRAISGQPLVNSYFQGFRRIHAQIVLRAVFTG